MNKKKTTLIKLKEQERLHRQFLIIEAAREVFGKKTYDKASMSEIARVAGIAKSSIYTYFKGQEELYACIVCQDAEQFITELNRRIKAEEQNIVRTGIDFFLDYYIGHQAQWRMITHFALHGNRGMQSVDQLNRIGRRLMDTFDTMFTRSGCRQDARLMSHTLFSCLSGILIAFRNYPGRTEEERIGHMKRIGRQVELLFTELIHRHRPQCNR